MAMQRFTKIFYGNVTSEHRKWALQFFTQMKRLGYGPIYIPPVGQFGIAKVAIAAGYRPEELWCSDISLFSGLLGHLYSGQPIQDLPFRFTDPAHQARFDAAGDDLTRVAVAMWVLRLGQFRPPGDAPAYEEQYREEFTVNAHHYIGQLREQLVKQVQTYRGLHYETADLRDVLHRPRDPKSLVVVNAPIYAKDYEKMFDFHGLVEWDPEIAQFHPNEWMGIYHEALARPEPSLWHRDKNVDGIDPSQVVFCHEAKLDTKDYWCFTQPNLLQGWAPLHCVHQAKPHQLRPIKGAAIFSDEDEIRPDSEIHFMAVEEATAFYYRDLWTHRIGLTRAEAYFLMLVDRKVFGTIGIHSQSLFLGKCPDVREVFGCNAPLTRYPRANRLLLLAITSKVFYRVLYDTIGKKNRFHDLQGVQTVGMTPYRQIRTHKGIFQLISSTKKDGMNHLLYRTDFRDDTVPEFVARFLKEEEQFMRSKQKKVEVTT